MDRICRIDTHAPLYTAADHPADHTGHVLFLVKIVSVLVNVTKSVDFLPGEMRGCRHQVFAFGLGGILKGRSHNIKTRYEPFIVAANLFPPHIEVSLHLFYALKPLFFGSH